MIFFVGTRVHTPLFLFFLARGSQHSFLSPRKQGKRLKVGEGSTQQLRTNTSLSFWVGMEKEKGNARTHTHVLRMPWAHVLWLCCVFGWCWVLDLKWTGRRDLRGFRYVRRSGRWVSRKLNWLTYMRSMRLWLLLRDCIFYLGVWGKVGSCIGIVRTRTSSLDLKRFFAFFSTL